MESLINQLNIKKIDFLKMDIEGSERNIIMCNGGWLEYTKAINVEIHHKKDFKIIKNKLIKSGFQISKCNPHPSSILAYK